MKYRIIFRGLWVGFKNRDFDLALTKTKINHYWSCCCSSTAVSATHLLELVVVHSVCGVLLRYTAVLLQSPTPELTQGTCRL